MATLAKEVVCALGGHPGEVFGARDQDAFAAWTETYEPGSPDACPLKLDEESPTHAWGSVMALGEILNFYGANAVDAPATYAVDITAGHAFPWQRFLNNILTGRDIMFGGGL